MVADNEFTLRGFVGKNVYVKKDPNGKWMMTDFLLGVWVGKDKQTGRNQYDNIPIKYWGTEKLESGEEIVVRGTIRMVKSQKTGKFEPQLSADAKGITFPKKITQMAQTYEEPQPDEGFFDDANEAMGTSDGIPF